MQTAQINRGLHIKKLLCIAQRAFFEHYYNVKESSASTHICKFPSRYSLAYSSGSSMASSLNRMGPSVNKCIIYIDHLPVKTFYLATVEGDQPHVRPFGAVCEFEGKLYIVTNNKKDVYNQMKVNGKVEMCGMNKGTWIRVKGAVKEDTRREAGISSYELSKLIPEEFKGGMPTIEDIEAELNE